MTPKAPNPLMVSDFMADILLLEKYKRYLTPYQLRELKHWEKRAIQHALNEPFTNLYLVKIP